MSEHAVYSIFVCLAFIVRYMNNCLFLFLSCCSGTGIFCLVEKRIPGTQFLFMEDEEVKAKRPLN